MRVAVTGAAGFVGRAVTGRLRELGWTVHGYDLRAGDGKGPDVEAVQIWDVAAGRLPHPPDVNAVVHTAALVAAAPGLAASRRVNVAGTAHVAASFPGARFVHISSCSVYDPWTPQVRAREDDAPAPAAIRWTNAYGRTKAEAEQWLAQHRPRAVVLRPHAVYGRGDTTLLPRLRAAGRRGVLPVPGPGSQLHSITWVQNLVDAVRLGCEGGPPGTYNIADAEPVTVAESLALTATPPGGTAPRVRPVPVAVLMPLAAASELVARLRTVIGGRMVEPTLTRYAVEHIGRERTFDIGRARDVLGYRPRPSRIAEAPTW